MNGSNDWMQRLITWLHLCLDLEARAQGYHNVFYEVHKMPTIATTIQTIRDQLADMHSRPGEALNDRAPAARLLDSHRSDELNDAIDQMVRDGDLRRDSRGGVFITASSCPMPNDEDVREHLVTTLKSFNSRVGDAIAPHQLAMRVGTDLRSAEIQSGLNAMLADGLLEQSTNGRLLIVAQSGHDLFGG